MTNVMTKLMGVDFGLYELGPCGLTVFGGSLLPLLHGIYSRCFTEFNNSYYPSPPRDGCSCSSLVFLESSAMLCEMTQLEMVRLSQTCSGTIYHHHIVMTRTLLNPYDTVVPNRTPSRCLFVVSCLSWSSALSSSDCISDVVSWCYRGRIISHSSFRSVPPQQMLEYLLLKSDRPSCCVAREAQCHAF